MEDGDDQQSHKKHRPRNAGRKADKKRAKLDNSETSAKQRNPKAFAIQSAVKAERRFRRKQDITSKRQQLPTVDRTPLEPPPVVVALVGPPQVGKTTLMRCLIKTYTRQNLTNIKGPVTIVSGKKRRLTFIECNNDINVMVDVAKVADLVLLLIDAKFGFEMETFEFLNICQVHGSPRIMGVLTHLDLFKQAKQLRAAKKQLKHRFWTEVYQGAKLFYLSGMIHDEYQKTEVKNLSRFISVMRFRPLPWRITHPYILSDRMEDVTNPERIRENAKCNRTVCAYGYIRGINFKNKTNIHIPGCGDFNVADVALLPDPCPLPDHEKRRSLNERERLIFAPMSGVGGIVYDKDAVYIELGGSHSHSTQDQKDEVSGRNKNTLVSSLAGMEHTVDRKIAASEMKIFADAAPIASTSFHDDEYYDGAGENDYEQEKGESDDEDEGTEDERSEEELETEDSEGESGSSGVDSDSDSDTNANDTAQEIHSPAVKKRQVRFSDNIDNSETGELKWKESLAEKAAEAFYKRQSTTTNLQKIVYGRLANAPTKRDDAPKLDDGDLFQIVKQKNQKDMEYSLLKHQEESSKFQDTLVQDWGVDEIRNKIKDCFVTGKWKESEDAETLLREADKENDGEVYGDFEDLETGEVHTQDKPANDADVQGTNDEDEMLRRKEKKRKLKEAFDSEYDVKDEDSGFYNDLKAEMDLQTQINKSEFEHLDDELRVQYEGYRPGMYVRVQINDVPCELVTNFDPTYPLILGGLGAGEENIGFVQVRLKKHRWYNRILKTKDPLIFSLGWRRFQSIVLYSMQDHNFRNRLLKYTPEHLHCMAFFWGPITPQNTGFLAFQSVGEVTSNYRIAATGVVLNLDKSTEIVKKLKLTGTPFKIYKKTAFIKGMFSTGLEVVKYEGANLRCVSGIRGQIKKALRSQKEQKLPEGSFRATFEDKILMSDIVFLRAWVTVEVPKFYNPVTSLLSLPEEKSKWQGMRTVGRLRKDLGTKPPVNEDSLYKPIERRFRDFKPMNIPRSLHRALPYQSKEKMRSRRRNDPVKQRVAVVLDHHEKEVVKLMKRLKTLNNYKKQKEVTAMKKRVDSHRTEMAKIEGKRLRRQKEVKKEICKVLYKAEQKKRKLEMNR